MRAGIVTGGTTGGSTAIGIMSARRDREYERERRDRDRRDRERRDRSRRGGYSQGGVNTAAIAGAVIGAIIAKNT
ncbi:hypothetical protein [Selenomonas artemidis]|uniref:hypothetical protein n=1 Tax=Selenomonas artemidis TaxID=671224 RepID=UPI0023F159F5|nr:hypothetical protein [Selenomonas artemidis]